MNAHATTSRRRLRQSQVGAGDRSRHPPPATKLFGDAVEVVGPALERLAYCVGHLRSVVGASYASLSATNVVECLFDYVGEDAEFAKHRCTGASKVVQAPRCDPRL